jgi:hypothetical protein
MAPSNPSYFKRRRRGLEEVEVTLSWLPTIISACLGDLMMQVSFAREEWDLFFKTTVIIRGDRPRWNSGFELVLDNNNDLAANNDSTTIRTNIHTSQ